MQVVFFKCKIKENNAFIKVLKRSRGDKFLIFVVGFLAVWRLRAVFA